MNSRNKGKRGERRWRDVLRDAGFLKAYRGAQYHGGPDSPDVQCPELPSLHFEVKAVERLNVWEAMAQAITDAGAAKTPVLAHTRNRAGWLVTMRAEDWLSLIRRTDLVASPVVGPPLARGEPVEPVGMPPMQTESHIESPVLPPHSLIPSSLTPCGLTPFPAPPRTAA